MANKEIQSAFIEGIHEVFTTLFNEGIEDGIYFYALDPNCKTDNVYGEKIGKKYLDPILLVCKVTLNTNDPSETFETITHRATFRVTYKSLIDNDVDVSLTNLKELEKGIVKYKDMTFKILKIQPNTYVEDVFLTYEFICEEQK